MNWLSFANPALGLCFLGILIPVVIHLLNRHDPRQIEFPTVRFLVQTLTERSVIHRFRRLILLLLRTALIALIAFAFLKPFVTYSKPVTTSKGVGTATALIVDASMSMGYSRRGATPLSKAKAEAARVLESLRPEDRANLIVARSAPAPSFPELGANIASLKQDVSGLEPTAERADIAAALRTAAAQLAKDYSPRREIYVFSDFQRSNWSDVDLSEVEKGHRVCFVDVGFRDAANRSIASVSIRPRAPVASEPVRILCEVANFSREAAEVPLRLSFDTGEEMKSSVTVGSFMSAPVSFSCAMGRPGVYAGQVSVPEDDLAPDDTHYFAVTVRPKIRVLLASNADPNDRRSGTYFLSRALKPYRDEAGEIRVAVERPAALGKADLVTFDAIVAVETGVMPTDTITKLFEYLNQGGSVAWFLCGGGEKENLASLERMGKGARLAPFGVGDLFDLSDQRSAFTYLREANFEGPMLRMFKDPERGDLSTLKFYRFHQTVDADDLAEVLLKYEDGTIAMAKRNVGSGTLMLCNFSPAPKSSNLAKNVNFVPMVHEMVRNLRPQESEGIGALVGERCQTSIEIEGEPQPIVVEGPKKQEIGVATHRLGGRVSVALEGADAPGMYRVLSNGETIAAIPVNVHPDESDLRPMDTEAIARRTRSDDKRFVQAGEGDNLLAEMRLGCPIWHYFLVASLVMMCVEQALAHRWRRR